MGTLHTEKTQDEKIIEARRAMQREYRLAHKEQIAARQRRYVEKHRDQLNAYSRAYRAAHPEKVKQWRENAVRRWMEKHAAGQEGEA